MTAILIFIFGLIVGSFLNVVIHRSPSVSRGSIFAKSSQCPRCGHALTWIDLVPVLSFFILGRRCRYCRRPISWQYPLVELATAVIFVLVYTTQVIPAKAGIQFLIFEASPRMTDYVEILSQLVFVSFLVVIFTIDLKHYLILDKIVLPGAVLALVYQIWQGRAVAALGGAVLLAGFFAILYFVSRGKWIGFGDVKLGIFLGFLVPYPQTLAVFFLAYFFGAAVAFGFVALGKKKFSDRLPFGTFLTSAAFIAMLWGQGIINWYFRLIGIS